VTTRYLTNINESGDKQYGTCFLDTIIKAQMGHDKGEEWHDKSMRME
jgi:hypothetical protein